MRLIASNTPIMISQREANATNGDPDGCLARYLSDLRSFCITWWPSCSVFVAIAQLLHTLMAALLAICRTCVPFAFHDNRFGRYLSQLRPFWIQLWCENSRAEFHTFWAPNLHRADENAPKKKTTKLGSSQGVNRGQVRQIARNTAQKHKNLEKTKKNKKFDEVRPQKYEKHEWKPKKPKKPKSQERWRGGSQKWHFVCFVSCFWPKKWHFVSELRFVYVFRVCFRFCWYSRVFVAFAAQFVNFMGRIFGFFLAPLRFQKTCPKHCVKPSNLKKTITNCRES